MSTETSAHGACCGCRRLFGGSTPDLSTDSLPASPAIARRACTNSGRRCLLRRLLVVCRGHAVARWRLGVWQYLPGGHSSVPEDECIEGAVTVVRIRNFDRETTLLGPRLNAVTQVVVAAPFHLHDQCLLRGDDLPEPARRGVDRLRARGQGGYTVVIVVTDDDRWYREPGCLVDDAVVVDHPPWKILLPHANFRWLFVPVGDARRGGQTQRQAGEQGEQDRSVRFHRERILHSSTRGLMDDGRSWDLRSDRTGTRIQCGQTRPFYPIDCL